MDLKQSLTLEALNKPQKEECPCKAARISAAQIAKQIFAAAMEQGAPYENITSKEWAKRWLASDEFILMEIQASAVAVPSTPMNKNKVLANIQASAMAPIVVDINKNGIGRAPSSGFTPKVIVVDGKHRHVSQVLQGHSKIQAWVGVRALKELVTQQAKVSPVRNKPASSQIEAAAQLHAGFGGTPVPRQDVGDGGSQPTMRMPSVKSTGKAMEPYTKGQKPVVHAHGKGCDCEACSDSKMKAAGASGAGTGGTGGPGGSTSGMNPLNKMFSKRKIKADADPSDTKSVIDPSDTKYPPDPSDRKMGNYDSEQGVSYRYSQTRKGIRKVGVELGPKSPAAQSPGSGVGPRMPRTGGASKSELSTVLGGGPGSGRHPGFGCPPGSESWCHQMSDKEKEGVQDWFDKHKPAETDEFNRLQREEALKQAPHVYSSGKKKKKKVAAGRIPGVIKTVAPPGREDQVKELKKKFGTPAAFKIAWDSYNKGKKK